MGVETPHRSGAAILARLHVPRCRRFRAGESAILNAILGGAGHEFVVLAEKEVHNILGVAAEFGSGTAPVHGSWARRQDAQLAERLHGLPHDVLALTVGGAILLKGKKIELAAIARGPYTTTPFSSQVVFAINRGAGARLGPEFAGRPGDHARCSGHGDSRPERPEQFRHGHRSDDRNHRAAQSLADPVAAPTVRVLVSASQLPSEGFALRHYKFAVYTQLSADHAISALTGSFVPEYSMIPIGVLTNVAPPRLL